MPLQNRVTPDMSLVAETWRGTMMGNRGGRIHDPKTKRLMKRKWASKRWICCVTQFKARQRMVMGSGYTELFFTDEVTALAAGHRPCFECRRSAANHFARLWQDAFGAIEGSVADNIDVVMHRERIAEAKSLTQSEICGLPDGAMIKEGSHCFAKYGDKIRRWTGQGYKAAVDLPISANLLTPPSVVAVLHQGYEPVWHPSVNAGTE